VASGSTTAPPPLHCRTTVVGQRRWRPEGRRDLLHRDIYAMDASGSAPSNDGLAPKPLVLLHSTSQHVLFVSRFPFVLLVIDPSKSINGISRSSSRSGSGFFLVKNSEYQETGFFFFHQTLTLASARTKNPNPRQTHKNAKGKQKKGPGFSSTYLCRSHTPPPPAHRRPEQAQRSAGDPFQ
jgi:hypothetical protein